MCKLNFMDNRVSSDHKILQDTTFRRLTQAGKMLSIAVAPNMTTTKKIRVQCGKMRAVRLQ